MTTATSGNEHDLDADGEDPAVTLARRLIARPSVTIAWGGRTRLLVADDGAVARFRRSLNAPAFRWSARAYRLLLAARTAVTRIRQAPPPRDALDAWLPPALSHLQPTSVIIGTPSRSQSLVAHLGDASGSAAAVAKVAVCPAGDAGIGREAAALVDSTIAGKAPRLLHAGTIADRAVIVTAFVAGRPGSIGSAGLAQAARVLPSPAAAAKCFALTEHPWARRVCEASGLSLKAMGQLMRNTLPIVRTHGDMAPWNLLVCRGGTILAIDWEASDPNGLPNTDLAHHLMATERLVRRSSPREAVAVSAKRLVRDVGLGQGEALVTTTLAAAATLLRERSTDERTADTFWEDAVDVAAKQVDQAASLSR